MSLPKILSVSTAQGGCDFCLGCAACALELFPPFLGIGVALVSMF